MSTYASILARTPKSTFYDSLKYKVLEIILVGKVITFVSADYKAAKISGFYLFYFTLLRSYEFVLLLRGTPKTKGII